MTAVRCWLVRGLVQGVGFRWFVRRRAEALGLTGFARNMADGSVEVVARGPEPALDQLAADLGSGPHLSQVHNVETLAVPQDLILPKFFDTR